VSLVHPVVTSPPVAHLGCATGIEAGAAGAPRKIEHDRAHHDWPVSRIRAGKTMLVGDLEDRFGQLHVHPQLDGGRRLELRGELDLTAAKALRTPLPDQLTGSGPVTLDLDGVNYLSSAGVGLLIDAAEHAEAHHVALQFAAGGGQPRRPAVDPHRARYSLARHHRPGRAVCRNRSR
jgi:ABC-type transporter Mla MlaB component